MTLQNIFWKAEWANKSKCDKFSYQNCLISEIDLFFQKILVSELWTQFFATFFNSSNFEFSVLSVTLQNKWKKYINKNSFKLSYLFFFINLYWDIGCRTIQLHFTWNWIFTSCTSKHIEAQLSLWKNWKLTFTGDWKKKNYSILSVHGIFFLLRC